MLEKLGEQSNTMLSNLKKVDNKPKGTKGARVLFDEQAKELDYLQDKVKRLTEEISKQIKFNLDLCTRNLELVGLLENLNLPYEEEKVIKDRFMVPEAKSVRYKRGIEHLSSKLLDVRNIIKTGKLENTILFLLTLFGIAVLTPITLHVLSKTYTLSGFLTEVNILLPFPIF